MDDVIPGKGLQSWIIMVIFTGNDIACDCGCSGLDVGEDLLQVFQVVNVFLIINLILV